MFRRRPINERLAEAVVKELQRRGLRRFDPERVISWQISVEENTTSVYLTIANDRKMNPHIVQGEPQDV